MAAKRFCDVCEAELCTDNNWSQGKHVDAFKGGVNWSVQLKVGLKAADEYGLSDVCKYCVIDMVNQHDERPRAAK